MERQAAMKDWCIKGCMGGSGACEKEVSTQMKGHSLQTDL
jgi:hypothetical protein